MQRNNLSLIFSSRELAALFLRPPHFCAALPPYPSLQGDDSRFQATRGQRFMGLEDGGDQRARTGERKGGEGARERAVVDK